MFATVFVLLYIAHLAADYAFQTDRQATLKSEPGRTGWAANLSHAATHVAACSITVTVGVGLISGLHLSAGRTIAAIAWVGVSHAFIDRRWPIVWWMDHTGSADFRARGGAAHVDQTVHLLALGVAAFIAAA